MAIALPSINQNIRSILYVRISSIILIYAGALALNAFYIQSIGSGIGVYSGLFQITTISQLLDFFDTDLLYFHTDDKLTIGYQVSLFAFLKNINVKKIFLSIADSLSKVLISFSHFIGHLIYKLFLFIILTISLYLIVRIRELDYSSVIVPLNNFISNGTVIYFSHKLLMGSAWFLIGYFSYLYLLPKSVVLKINSSSFLKIFIFLFTIFIVKSILETLIYDYVATSINEFNYYNIMTSAGGKPCTCGYTTPASPSNVNPANALIMAVATAGAFKLGTKVPTLTTKAFCGGILAGSLGIATSNITNNLTSNSGKYNFISKDEVMDILTDALSLTGNDAIDLLIVIQSFQRLQFLFITLICYNILFTRINLAKLESFLSRFLPLNIVRWYVKSMALYQKSSLFFLICLIILLLFCNYYSIYYLGFFIDNFDDIVNLCSKK